MRWVLVVCLSGGAVVVGWPGGAVARRRLRVPESGSRGGGFSVGAVAGVLGEAAERQPRRVLSGSVAVASALGLATGGPVAGVVAAVYAGLFGRALIRRRARRRAAVARLRELDELAALAADLRAGLPSVAVGPRAGLPSVAAGPLRSGASGVGRIARLTASVWRLAEQTGAPAADLVERIEADARAADRAAASAAAQAAGAQATAMLLAALPLGGIGLGMAIGADPVHVLLRTPLGAACLIVAVLLQAGGLLWADRLAAAGVAA